MSGTPSWAHVAAWFDPEFELRLPDGDVPGTGPTDWPAFFALVRARAWPTGTGAADDIHPVWPVPGLQVNFFRRDDSGIEFDVDIREIRGQESLDALCAFLADLGRAFGRDVRLCPEGMADREILRFDVAADRITTPLADN